MSVPGPPPEPPSPPLRSRVSSDPDVKAGARFLKRLGIGVIVSVLAFGIVAVGALAIAFGIRGVYLVLERGKVVLPAWAHGAEVQSGGLVIAVLILLSLVIAGQEALRVAFGREKEEPSGNKAAGKTSRKRQ